MSKFSQLDVHLGQRIADRRKAIGLHTDVVCQTLEIDPQGLRAREGGQVSFTAAELYNLCSILDVEPSWLFSEYQDS